MFKEHQEVVVTEKTQTWVTELTEQSYSCSLWMKLVKASVCLFAPAVLHRGELWVRKCHGCHAGQRRHLSHHRWSCVKRRSRSQYAEPHAFLRDVRLFRAICLLREYLYFNLAMFLRVSLLMTHPFLFSGGPSSKIWSFGRCTAGGSKCHGRYVLVSSVRSAWKQCPRHPLLSGWTCTDFICSLMWQT